MYWLAKEKIAHHIKFSSLVQLAKSLGSFYYSEIEVAQTTNYSSVHMIDEFVTILS